MKPQKPEIISLPNEVFKNELTAINQYYLYAKILEDMGYEQLAQRECAEAIEEMKHADWLETQLGLIEGMGLENYLQSQMKPV